MTAFVCPSCSMLLTNGHCLHALIVGETVVAKPGTRVVHVCGRCGSAKHMTNECPRKKR